MKLSRAGVSGTVTAVLVIVVIVVAGAAAYYVTSTTPATTVTSTAPPTTKTATVTATTTAVTTATATTTAITTVTTSSTSPVKVAMLLPGVISDGSWNLAGYIAINAIGNKMHIPIAYAESVSPSACPTVGTNYVNSGYNVIILDDISLGNCAFTLGNQFPNTKFMWVGALNFTKNVITVTDNGWDASYLCGIVAAGASKTGVIGFESAISFFTVNADLNAYIQGARLVNPNIKVHYTFTGAFHDTLLGKQAANTLHSQGVDVIHAFGDGLTLGVIQSAVENNYFAIGYQVDQNGLAPKNVLTSDLWNQTAEFSYVIKNITQGTFKSQVLTGGYAAGYVGIAPFHGLDANISAKALTLLAQAEADFTSGKFFIIPNATLPAQQAPAAPASPAPVHAASSTLPPNVFLSTALVLFSLAVPGKRHGQKSE